MKCAFAVSDSYNDPAAYIRQDGHLSIQVGKKYLKVSTDDHVNIPADFNSMEYHNY